MQGQEDTLKTPSCQKLQVIVLQLPLRSVCHKLSTLQTCTHADCLIHQYIPDFQLFTGFVQRPAALVSSSA